MALDQAFQHGSTPNITWLLSDQDREVAVDDNGNPCHKYSHPFCGFVSREDDLDAANPNYRHQYCYSWRTTPFDEARVLCKSYWCRYFQGQDLDSAIFTHLTIQLIRSLVLVSKTQAVQLNGAILILKDVGRGLKALMILYLHQKCSTVAKREK